MVRIEQLDCSPVRAQAAVEEILREYLTWCVERLTADCGVVLDDPAAVIQAHHEDFCHELPHLLGPRGQLLIACLDGQIVGTGALKPVDAITGEIKRMYVRPHARRRRHRPSALRSREATRFARYPTAVAHAARLASRGLTLRVPTAHPVPGLIVNRGG
ncbi:hypothetical protein K1W54_15480 [Micromonospora sp. CPCC 205371]|nr:hypothetical protein [Micromonospora sp. CPCC 205371]